MTRSLSSWQAILLGLVVVAGMIVGGMGLFAIGSRQWYPDAFHLRAHFDNVGGLEVGTRVRIQGIDAGEVSAIDLPEEPGGAVIVKMQVAGKFRNLLRTNSKVQIGGESLLAGKVVNILPGTVEADLLDDDAFLTTVQGGDIGNGLAEASTRLNKILAKADKVIQDFEEGKGPVGETTKELREASSRLNKVLAKAESTLNEVEQGKGTLGKILKDDKLYEDVSTVVSQVNLVLNNIRQGEGTLGKLLKDQKVYNETMKSLQDVRQMVTSVKQNSDAIKALPLVRNYVVDINKELNRPRSKRYRIFLEERKLFEPGKAVLTSEGQKALDFAAQWLNDRKDPNSEVVIAAFADPKYSADFAQTLSEKQSETVMEYLRNSHSIHRMGWWWWSNRTVKALGCGNAPSPVPETETLPAARVELIVFVPNS